MGNVVSLVRERPLDAWLALGGVLAAASVPLYVFLPSGSIRNFGGTPSPTACMWVQTVAAGDALVAFLAWEALRSGSVETKRLAARAIGVYNLLHMGSFINGHLNHVPSPQGLGVPVASLILGSAASAYWGWLGK